MAYDPRAVTGIPTESVGSLPRPMKLQEAYAAYDAGKIKLTDTLAGTGLADKLGGGGQYFAIFADGHKRQLPRLTGGPFKYKAYAADSLRKSIKWASKPMKQAVIAPSMIVLLYPLDEKLPGYSLAQFEADICDECEKDIRGAFAAGAVRVSIDFTEGRLNCRNDARNPWTGRKMLPHFIELNNRVLARFSAQERVNIGVHTCPGGDCDSVHSADVPSSERNKEQVYKDIAASLRSDANGVKQVAFIGVTNPLNPRVESPEEVADALVAAAKHIPKDQLGSTDDCGFSPFSIDVKPSHGSPDAARDIAFQKISNRVKGTLLAAERLGIHKESAAA